VSGLPCIVEVALNGATPKQANPHVPRSPEEIATDALRCIAVGATIVHNHNDEPTWVPDGLHSPDPYVEAWTPIKARHPDVLLYPTMASGGPGTEIDTRWGHHVVLARARLAEIALVDPGSLSAGTLDDRGLPAPSELVYINTFSDTIYMIEGCHRWHLAPSVSIFDPSFLRIALLFHRAGALPRGTMIKLYFGGDALPFGLPPTLPSLDAYLAMLADTGLAWSVAVQGGDVVGCGLASAALQRGGHVRVGLEDYAGPRTPSNVELIEELTSLIVDSGRTLATPAVTRATLGIPAP
jgi:3-keto-5-aminohexanoate cleavage enzyme